MDYGDAFHLLDQLGITTIFRFFPERVKDYAFYTRIHDHRVVFVNNSTNVLDLIFPVLHEAVNLESNDHLFSSAGKPSTSPRQLPLI